MVFREHGRLHQCYTDFQCMAMRNWVGCTVAISRASEQFVTAVDDLCVCKSAHHIIACCVVSCWQYQVRFLHSCLVHVIECWTVSPLPWQADFDTGAHAVAPAPVVFASVCVEVHVCGVV